MVDWLVVWGVAQAAGFAFKPILEELATESVKDYTKDFFKDCLKKVIHLPEKDAQKEAYGKALKEFLQLVQQELEDADYQDAQIKQYLQPLRKFVAQESVAAALGSAFEESCRGLDTQLLAKTWRGLELPYLPESFDWEQVSKRYLRKVRAIVNESDKLRPIFAAQSQAKVAEGVKELVGIAPAFDLGRYAEGLREQYGKLKLESLDTTGVYYNELKLWKMFVPQTVRECQEFLPQVYEIPKEHVRRLRQQGEVDEVELAEVELERYRRIYVEQPIRSVLEVVGNPGNVAGISGSSPVQYAVILGDPGSGKSTLLQYLALVWAERPLSELPLHPIPLLIELRSYARDKQAGQCNDILGFIHSGNVTCRLNQQQFHEKLNAGQAIALFDGVDEVFDPVLRDQVVTDIHRFTNDYARVQVIVTSRWLGYKAQRLRDAEFRHFMLQDLEAEQIEEFVQRWHDLTFVEGADKQRKQERLQKAIQESKAIRELAGNPLLLTMMAILNRNQELPRDRPELYNQASRVLLHQWDVERALVEDHRLDPKTIDYRDKQAMLRKVAYHMQSSEKGLAGNIISANDLENILTEYLRTIEVEQPRVVARLMINQLRTRNFILCSLGGESYAFVHRTFLEYFCAWEFVWQFKETQTLTFEQLRDEVFGQYWQDETWQEVLRLISGMIDTKFVAGIIDYLIEQNGEKSEFINVCLAAKCLLEVKNRSLLSKTEANLLEKLKFLTKYDIDNDRERNRDEFHRVYRIRTNPIWTIVETWEGNPEILNWLRNLTEFSGKEIDGNVQREAIRAISKCRKGDLEVLSWLKSLVHSNEWWIKYGAVWALMDDWKSDSEILSIFRNSAEFGEVWGIRVIGLQGLAQSCKNSPDTLLLLKDRAENDENQQVRSAAVQELAQGWKDNPEIFEFLYDRALQDTFQREESLEDNPRQTALEAILKNYPEHPKTLELLINHTNNDPDEKLREFAKQQLEKLEKKQ